MTGGVGDEFTEEEEEEGAGWLGDGRGNVCVRRDNMERRNIGGGGAVLLCSLLLKPLGSKLPK